MEVLDRDGLDELTNELVMLAGEYCSTYDGWSCEVQRG